MSDSHSLEEASVVPGDISLQPGSPRRSELGQFMTPPPVAGFMAGLFSDTSGDLRVLDPGAGMGSLTVALVERLCKTIPRPRSVSLHCIEIDPLMVGLLRETLRQSELQLKSAKVCSDVNVMAEDFILARSDVLQGSLFDDGKPNEAFGSERFTHIIMNPPYKKIHSKSEHRIALRRAGIETQNLYTGFLYLAARQLAPRGELVAIVPRSFCNGPYFREFRKRFFSLMTLRDIHVFHRRDSAFRGDNVLQENVIIHAVKAEEPANITVTASKDAAFDLDPDTGNYIADGLTRMVTDYGSVIRPDDPQKQVRIPTSNYEHSVVERMKRFGASLGELGLDVSTGPIVDFRMKMLLEQELKAGSAPLLYPAHFRNGGIEWPTRMKKPNAIKVTETSRKGLWPNQGCFVVTRRFTSKEERRRVVASVYTGDLPGELVGFENHLNVYHEKHCGFSPRLAAGLSVFLNSTIVDHYFRQFNGHTQVNATDLRQLPYPERRTLELIGDEYSGKQLSQEQIDHVIESVIA